MAVETETKTAPVLTPDLLDEISLKVSQPWDHYELYWVMEHVPALVAVARRASLDRLTVEMAEAMRETWQADVTKAEAERDNFDRKINALYEAGGVTADLVDSITAERDAAVAAKEAAYAEGVEAAAKLADDFDYEPYRKYLLAWDAVCNASEAIGRQIRGLSQEGRE